MEFIINSQVLSKQVQSLSGVLTNSNTVPIINCFHFHIEENQLTIKATDLETTIVSRVEIETAKLEGVSEVAVPSKLLLDILKYIDNSPMNFSIDENNPCPSFSCSIPAYGEEWGNE